MQKVFINQGITILPEILNDLRIKKIFLVVGNNAYQSIENLIKPYTKSASIETFIMKTKLKKAQVALRPPGLINAI